MKNYLVNDLRVAKSWMILVLLVEAPRVKPAFIGSNEFNFAIPAILALLHSLDSRSRVGHILVSPSLSNALSFSSLTPLV